MTIEEALDECDRSQADAQRRSKEHTGVGFYIAGFCFAAFVLLSLWVSNPAPAPVAHGTTTGERV